MRRFARTQAQAIVEFALAATLIFLLLSAAIDVGLLFFTKQALTNAAQEGATYGSRWLIGDSTNRTLDIKAIQDRVRFESGSNGGNGVIKLTDLNNDGIDDASQSGVVDPTGATGYIQVRAIADQNMDGNPMNDGPVACANPATSTVSCYAMVTVRKAHKMFMGLAPVFGNPVMVSSTYYLLIRDSFRGGSSTPPTFVVPTATPDPNSIVVQVVVPSGTTFPSAQNGTRFQVTAYDKNLGTTNGAGIDHVVLQLYGPNGSLLASNDDYAGSYCLFGGTGSCSQMDTTIWNNLQSGSYVFRATAYTSDGRTGSVTVNLTK